MTVAPKTTPPPSRSDPGISTPRDEPAGEDRNNGIVPLPPQTWLIGFVPALKREWWHSLLNRYHAHVFAMRPLGPDQWLVVEPWWRRTPIAVIPDRHARRFLLWAARGDLLAADGESPGRSTQLRGMGTCAALIAHILGRPYMVWTPHSLYTRLVREETTVKRDAKAIVRTMAQPIDKTGNQAAPDRGALEPAG